MKNNYRTQYKAALVGCSFLCACFTGWAQDDEEEEVFELSPFTVDAASDEGYYASQTMAGGRLSGSLKDTGAAVQVITKEFMEDLGATGIEELLQYTTSSEVAGILGNFTGASEGALGETNVGGARRDPDGTSRIRGMAAPDRTRNFFITDIPFDAYNTERIDINRGANSFLFGLGSPAGLINNGMAQARFRDSNEVSFRVGSGGRSPTYRGSFKLNRVVVEDKLAVYVAGLMDRTQYRQRPTHKDDDRIYTSFSYRPFGNTNTVIRGHMETGEIVGNAPDVLLPQENFSTFLETPAVMNSSLFVRDWSEVPGGRNHEGITRGNFNRRYNDEEKQAFIDAGYIIRNSGGPEGAQFPDLVYRNIRWGGGAYGHVWDGRNGSLENPSFSYSDQIPGLALERVARGDELENYWAGGTARNGGAPQNLYPGNLGEIMGVGWIDQGFTDLETFDFSRANLGWDNDFYTRDFFNYNFALEQTFWEGKGGFSIEYDFQDLFRNSFTALNGGNSVITFDVNETILLPEDPNYLVSGNLNPMPNPNYGRPVIMTKSGRRTNDDQRTAKRFTGFVKHDFKDSMNNDRLANFLGEHTFTVLGDQQRHHETLINFREAAFGIDGGFEPALHIGPANARQATNNARNTPNMVYIGPPQLNAWDDYTSITDFIIEPARYNLQSTTGKVWDKLTWNLGPDATTEALTADTDRSNGNEQWTWEQWIPIETATKNVRLQETTVSSLAFNTQSRMLGGNLVVNLGYREDTVENWLNTEPPLIGLDEISDVSPQNWLLTDGTFTEIQKDIFGYGAVLYWPKDIIPLPEFVDDITFHYNTSDNFVPSLDRVDEFRQPIPSQFGDTKDWGISAYLFNDKVVARINWYDANLINATSPVSSVYNRNMIRIPQWYGRLNRRVVETDKFKIDGEWDADLLADEFDVNPEGQYEVGDEIYDTIEEAADALWPNLDAAAAAREPLEQFVFDPRFIESFNLRFLADGDINSQWAGAISDTTDINSKGMEAEIILNPTKNWRIAFNAAQQETTLSNIAPRLTEFVNFLVPYTQEFGWLDWSNPAEEVDGATFTQQIGDRLLEYYYVKNLEGRPTAEQREWRFNLVTNYQFREGKLNGFSFGGAARWQDDSAAGFPVFFDETLGFYQPDVENPWRDETDLAIDLTFGYRKKIGDVDWRLQLNLRNVHNWDNTDVDITRFQPDGRPARARFAPPRQILLTNTFRW